MLPLVSIMMPCYNSARTLPWALASLVAQTFKDWECLLVDDGSTDQPLDVASRVGDPRIKLIRLDRNMGRGAARQVALERATGSLLCMLDADDWLYPSKIERQVAALERAPEIALVSAGMAIVDVRNHLAGIRCRGPAGPLRPSGPVRTLGAPPVAFGPALLRIELARQFRFDANLASCEDNDYLIRLLFERKYAILPDVGYVYTEHASASREKILRDMQLLRLVYAKHRDRFPVGSRWNVAATAAKELIYRGAFAVGLGRSLIERRSAPPTDQDREEFAAARRTVGAIASQLFRVPVDSVTERDLTAQLVE